MLEALIVAGLVLAQAPECRAAVETREGALRLRPACPVGYARTHEVVRTALASAGEAPEARIFFGRIVEYPWLSSLLARQASSSRRWDPAAGAPVSGTDNQYVAAALRGMPEFTALFDAWQVAGVSVEKVLIRPAAELSLPQGAPLPPHARLPYDAMLWVTLRRAH